MAPKDDPETAALKKELTDLIAKFQVNFCADFKTICKLVWLSGEKNINNNTISVSPLSRWAGGAEKSERLHVGRKMWWSWWRAKSAFVNETLAQRAYQQSEFRALCGRFTALRFRFTGRQTDHLGYMDWEQSSGTPRMHKTIQSDQLIELNLLAIRLFRCGHRGWWALHSPHLEISLVNCCCRFEESSWEK